MNANELADRLNQITGYSVEYEHQHNSIQEAATMLRQQQAEIENLRRINKHEHIVAENALREVKALKAKTLTDEKIGNIANEVFGEFNWSKQVLTFASAILRKAQE